MKPSKFNIIFDHEDKLYMANTLTKSILQINKDIKEVIENNQISKLCTEEQKVLLKNGFAINEDIDEIGLLRYRANKIKNSKEEMEFVIAPTLACNFKCSYCFESARNGFMEENIQKKVLDFIFDKSNTEDNKKIHIIWFGGEPLLYPNIVNMMNREIYNYCQNKKKEFKSDIITNGYLLTKDLVFDLIESHIDHLQITIDGCKKHHDQRRILKNGLGTYDTIYENLKLLKDTPIDVTIRMNIDKNNLNDINRLETEINRLGNPNIHCSPAIVEISEKHLDDIKGNCFSDQSSLEGYYGNPQISKYFISDKISDYSLRLFFCEAEHAHSFAIDELGNVYKCWNSLGVEKEIYCTVCDYTENPAVLSIYFARDPFTEFDCIECPYIPICAGGCIKQKMLHNNKNFCAESKFNFLKSAKKEIDNMLNKK